MAVVPQPGAPELGNDSMPRLWVALGTDAEQY
jgi:hypothetical protein